MKKPRKSTEGLRGGLARHGTPCKSRKSGTDNACSTRGSVPGLVFGLHGERGARSNPGLAIRSAGLRVNIPKLNRPATIGFQQFDGIHGNRQVTTFYDIFL